MQKYLEAIALNLLQNNFPDKIDGNSSEGQCFAKDDACTGTETADLYLPKIRGK